MTRSNHSSALKELVFDFLLIVAALRCLLLMCRRSFFPASASWFRSLHPSQLIINDSTVLYHVAKLKHLFQKVKKGFVFVCACVLYGFE